VSTPKPQLQVVHDNIEALVYVMHNIFADSQKQTESFLTACLQCLVSFVARQSQLAEEEFIANFKLEVANLRARIEDTKRIQQVMEVAKNEEDLNDPPENPPTLQ
jgi:hypothetical protein